MESIVSLLRSACEDSEMDFRESYSGRGMYGRKCVGIVGSMKECQQVISTLVSNMTSELFADALNSSEGEHNDLYAQMDTVVDYQQKLLDFSWDSMGTDCIVYWEQIEPEELPLPSDEEIDAMTMREVVLFLKKYEELMDEDDCTRQDVIRETAKEVRERIRNS